jgi:hypothetical protein
MTLKFLSQGLGKNREGDNETHSCSWHAQALLNWQGSGVEMGLALPTPAAPRAIMTLMVQMWIGGPEARDPERLQRIDAEGARVRAEVQALQAGDEATCRVCGSLDDLTDEHAPSRKVGDVGRLVRETVDPVATEATGEVAWKAVLLQGGA